MESKVGIGEADRFIEKWLIRFAGILVLTRKQGVIGL